jgi:large subunit ribosomal protein L21
MYAVIKTGGKQYRVTSGETLKVEIIPGDVGSSIVLDKVLMVADGDSCRRQAFADRSLRESDIVAHGRGDKVRIFKMRAASTTRKIKVIARATPRSASTASRPSSRRNFKEQPAWHQKKAAAVPVTDATHTQNDWA